MQNAKKYLWWSLIFSKTTGGYPLILKKEHYFFTFGNDIGGSSSQVIFNFVMHLDQQHLNRTAI